MFLENMSTVIIFQSKEKKKVKKSKNFLALSLAPTGIGKTKLNSSVNISPSRFISSLILFIFIIIIQLKSCKNTQLICLIVS